MTRTLKRQSSQKLSLISTNLSTNQNQQKKEIKKMNLVLNNSKKNLDALKKALDEVQGNAKVNILDVDQILSMFQNVEKKMDELRR